MSLKSIAILHYSCPPVVGGVEEIVRQQASLFHRNYHPLKIIAGTGGYFRKDLDIEIHPLLSSRNEQIVELQKDVQANLAELKNIAHEIQSLLSASLASFDVLIAHNVLTMPYNLPLTMALHALADDGLKIIGWNHDSPFFYASVDRHLHNGVWKILKQYNSKITYITISKSRKKEFQKIYGDGKLLKVISNGIDPIRFLRLDSNSARLIQNEGLLDCQLVMVQPSRLHPRKNIELSIQVLKALRDLNVDVKLLLTGAFDHHEEKTMEYYNRLRALSGALGVDDRLVIISQYKAKNGRAVAADRVIMRDLYQISDLLFLPSKQEGFGIPVLEAGMIRLPIACSDIPPFRTIAGENVLYFSLQDPAEEIAAKIVAFMKKIPTYRMFKTVMKEYVWDGIYRKQILPLLETI